MTEFWTQDLILEKNKYLLILYSEKEIQTNNLSETLYRIADDTLVLVHGPSCTMILIVGSFIFSSKTVKSSNEM